MKKNRLFIYIIIIIIFISIIVGCSTKGKKLQIDGGKDSTSYTYEQKITILYYHDSEFQDSIFRVGEENDPILCGYFYRFSYEDNELFINMNNKYYKYSFKNDELSEYDNNEFYDEYVDYGVYRWIYPHLK